jgi:phosphoglucosamine mutase
MSERLFGTDGIRGVAGMWPLDPPTIARVGTALVRSLELDRRPRILLGRDTRESGEWIERELARGLTAAGAEVISAGVVPTPAVAYLAGSLDVDLGVVLSASHNPHRDNGIKVFSGRGEKFGESEQLTVERLVADAAWSVGAANDGITVNPSLVDAYLDHVQKLMPSAGPLTGARLALDMANGATTATAPRLFERLGFDVRAIGDRPDGRNINLACGSTHPANVAAATVSGHCRLGAAFDGDGDRVILVDARGQVVDGDAVLLILALAFHAAGRLTGNTVVATVMSNIGLELALAARGIRLVRTPVGDRHVMEEMSRGQYVLGGEQSGHVILTEHLPTGDGVATLLAVLRVMAETGRELADLADQLVTFPQTLINVRVRTKTPVDEVPEIAAAVARVTSALDGRGRLLVRYSGTEPLLRVMIEGEDQASVQMWAEEIAEAIRTTLG